MSRHTDVEGWVKDRDWHEDFLLVLLFFAVFVLVGLVFAAALNETAVLNGALGTAVVVIPVTWLLTRRSRPPRD